MSVTTDHLIRPHGGVLVERTGARPDDLDSLEVITLTSRELADLDMLASGALSPLTGFMGREDYEGVVESMQLANGLRWALPVCLSVAEAPEGRPGRPRRRGRPARWPCSTSRRSTPTTRSARPSSASARPTASIPASRSSTRRRAPTSPAPSPSSSGSSPSFPELHKDPADTRALFAERGWKRVVGFQTRNPIHRAHEYLTKCALETVDGLLIHPLVGATKSDDVPVDVRVKAYDVLVGGLLPGRPRRRLRLPGGDALRRARARRSGTRSAARTTAARTSSSAATTPASGATTAPTTRSSSSTSSSRTSWTSSRCSSSTPSGARSAARWRPPKTCPHGGDDHVFLSGTKVRELLAAGELPPEEFTRPEVAEILIEAYRG